MQFTAQQIAPLVGGTIEGDPKAAIHTFAKIEDGEEGAISFLYDKAYTHFLAETRSSIVLVSRDMEVPEGVKATLIRVDDAREAVAKLMLYAESLKPRKTGISPQAYIAETATIGDDCYIAPFAYVGENVVIGRGTQLYPHAVVYDGAQIGDDCTLYSNVSVYHDCRIGSRCILHAGAVVGADGFGFAPTPEGYEKIPQIGIVTIEDDVEIGANTCVDRSTMGSTYVRRGVKLDNLVQIAHNDDIGSHTVMSSQVGVAGTTTVGEWCMFGGQVGIADHCTIAPHTLVGAQGGVAGGVKKPGQTLQGSPVIDAKRFWKASVVFKNLPELQRAVSALRREVDEMKNRI